jgi:hypothetical protein
MWKREYKASYVRSFVAAKHVDIPIQKPKSAEDVLPHLSRLRIA